MRKKLVLMFAETVMSILGLFTKYAIILKAKIRQHIFVNYKARETCICFDPPPNHFELFTPEHYKRFGELRDMCPALNVVYLPDAIWNDFMKMTQDDLDRANHLLIQLDAYDRGYLHKLTSPVHRYLLDGNDYKDNVKKDYKKDLQGKWILEEGELRRHQLSRRFRGKLTELQCAEWLENEGWEICGLEALGGAFDIEAVSPERICHVFEVKFIGQDDNIFLYTNKLNGGTGIGSSSPYQAHDFLLVKMQNAASQLAGKYAADKKRVALLVIENISWPFFRQVIKDDWINVSAPEFKYKPEEAPENLEQAWGKFLEDDLIWKNFLNDNGLINSYGLPDGSKLQIIHKELDELWIVAESDGYKREIKRKILTYDG